MGGRARMMLMVLVMATLPILDFAGETQGDRAS